MTMNPEVEAMKSLQSLQIARATIDGMLEQDQSPLGIRSLENLHKACQDISALALRISEMVEVHIDNSGGNDCQQLPLAGN